MSDPIAEAAAQQQNGGDAGNVVASSSKTVDATSMASGGEQAVSGIVGLVDHAASIRNHIANIKQHLSVRGFELSLVADIHAELDKIESHL